MHRCWQLSGELLVNTAWQYSKKKQAKVHKCNVINCTFLVSLLATRKQYYTLSRILTKMCQYRSSCNTAKVTAGKFSRYKGNWINCNHLKEAETKFVFHKAVKKGPIKYYIL